MCAAAIKAQALADGYAVEVKPDLSDLSSGDVREYLSRNVQKFPLVLIGYGNSDPKRIGALTSVVTYRHEVDFIFVAMAKTYRNEGEQLAAAEFVLSITATIETALANRVFYRREGDEDVLLNTLPFDPKPGRPLATTPDAAARVMAMSTAFDTTSVEHDAAPPVSIEELQIETGVIRAHGTLAAGGAPGVYTGSEGR